MTRVKQRLGFQQVIGAVYSHDLLCQLYEERSGPELLDLSASSIRALSIRQPFVEQILRGEKNIEYRSWHAKKPGPLLLHVSSTRSRPEVFADAAIVPDTLPYGALVGVVDLLECVWNGKNEKFEWFLTHPRRFAQPIPYKGKANIFHPPMEIIQAALKALT